MKVTADLRVAVKAVCETAEARDRLTRAATYRAWQKRLYSSIQKFIKDTPEVKTALATIKRAEAEKAAAIKVVENAGISHHYLERDDCRHAINSIPKFEQAGGVYPTLEATPDYKDVLARLSLATEEDGQKILKSLGIKW